jgi:DNA-binding MarR family transcriptional regulator
MMTLDEHLLQEAKGVRERLLDLQHEVDRARVDYQHVIRRLHAAGGSMREIAEELGLSHQRVHQIVDAGPEDARLRRGRGHFEMRRGAFGRFTRPAREALEHAQAEATELGHNYLGTEHVLLGLFRSERGGAADALASLSLTHDQVRQALIAELGEAKERPRSGPMPMTPRLKQAFREAVKEAKQRRYRHVGTEHLLLGLVDVEEGLAAQILASLGADAPKVREAVEKVLGR